MKKIAVSVLAVLMALTTVIGMAGCGDSKEEQLLNSYVMSSDFQSNLKKIQSAKKGMATVSTQVSGRKLTFVFRMSKQLTELEINTMKLQLNSNIDSLLGGKDFSEWGQKIREKTAIQFPMIGIEMYNMDGGDIVKIEYDSQTMQTKVL